MEIDKQTLKALSSESRLAIMKSLAERRKMPAELQRALGLSGSTIVGHLEILERTGLVKRIETGHKWIYYDLTQKGVDLIKPKFPVQFVLILSLGVLLVFGGFIKYVMTAFAPQAVMAGRAAELVGAETAAAVTIDWILVAAIAVGLVLLAIGIAGLMRGRLRWSR